MGRKVGGERRCATSPTTRGLLPRRSCPYRTHEVQGALAFAPTAPDLAVHAQSASELLPELSQRTRGGNRTPALLVRSQALYPLSYTGIGTVDPILRFPIMSHPLTVGQRQHILTPGVGVCRTGVSSNFVGLP